jgi:hypothetical protein
VVVDAEKKENEKERKRKTLSSEERNVVKKSLTGSTLLEMSGSAFIRTYAALIRVESPPSQKLCHADS